ncbi:NAD(P)-binding protein [Serendipita vermifera]|nr:NAD(P)-binding protein [Serendipita vermifera]
MRDQERPHWSGHIHHLTRRTVIVTGADIGIGLDTIISLHRRKAKRVILAARDLKRGEQAKMWIESSSLKEMISDFYRYIDVWELDLNSFDSVKRFANRCLSELDRLDLLLNAAVATRQFSMTADGYESTVQTNVLSTFLLSTLLMPLLQKTARMEKPEGGFEFKPRLVLVSSDAHLAAGFSQKNAQSIYSSLNRSSSFDGYERCRTTKLMALLLLRQLSYVSGEKENNDVVICAVNPGFSKFEKMHKIVGWRRWLLYKCFAKTTLEASRNIEWACFEDNIPSGSYVSRRTISDYASWIDTTEGQKVQFKLWKETGEILTIIAPETEKLWDI